MKNMYDAMNEAIITVAQTSAFKGYSEIVWAVTKDRMLYFYSINVEPTDIHGEIDKNPYAKGVLLSDESFNEILKFVEENIDKEYETMRMHDLSVKVELSDGVKKNIIINNKEFYDVARDVVEGKVMR